MEEQKQDRRKTCRFCGQCEGFYTKKYTHFVRAKESYCRYHKKIVSNGETCEHYQRSFRQWSLRQASISRKLFEILSELAAIRQVIEENKEENAVWSGR